MPFKDPKQEKAYRVKYYSINAENIKVQRRLYRSKNIEIIKMKQKERYERDKVKILARQRAYHNRVRGERQEMWNKKGRERTFRLKLRIIEHYSTGTNRCACCGEGIIYFLSIDHINNNGARERRELKNKGGQLFYRYLVTNNFPKGYQILCMNCNLGKQLCGVCPHNKLKK